MSDFRWLLSRVFGQCGQLISNFHFVKIELSYRKISEQLSTLSTNLFFQVLTFLQLSTGDRTWKLIMGTRETAQKG